MGYNTSVIVINDSLDYIQGDKDFGAKLSSAIHQVGYNRTVDVSACAGMGVHCNAATVIETHHADQTSVVAFGGNCGQILAHVGGWRNDLRNEDDKVKLLKQVADSLGYTIRKKPSRLNLPTWVNSALGKSGR